MADDNPLTAISDPLGGGLGAPIDPSAIVDWWKRGGIAGSLGLPSIDQQWRSGNDMQRAQLLAGAFGPGSIAAWHGTPVTTPFREFSNNTLGTGEGAKAPSLIGEYGMGHYVSADKDIGEVYQYLRGRNQPGSLLQIHIHPDHEDFLDWNAPLGTQNPEVADKIRSLSNPDKLGPDWASMGHGNMDELTGGDIHGMLTEHLDPVRDYFKRTTKTGIAAKQRVADLLHSVGVPGITYKDPEFSSPSKGVQNYVVFDPSNITIKTWNGIPLTPVDHDPFEGAAR